MAKAKGKPKAKAKAAGKPKAKPQSFANESGTLSVIVAKGRVYISCCMDSTRRQWVQVTGGEAASMGTTPLEVVTSIFERLREDRVLSEPDAKRIKTEIMDA